MKREIRLFFTSLLYFTRIPCPQWVDHSEEYVYASSRYFPLIGILIGLISGFIFYITRFIFDPSISIILSMIASVMLTGGFHEDGLADMCDGFGGGWTCEKILAIMKDSRIGTFGAIGLLSALALKYLTLSLLPEPLLLIILVTSNAISRWLAVTFLYTDSYARMDLEDAKAKPFSKKMSLPNVLIAFFFCLIPLSILMYEMGNIKVLWVFPMLFIIRYMLGRMFKKWIGGYTGDCLGGAQQITEIIFYLGVLVILKF